MLNNQYFRSAVTGLSFFSLLACSTGVEPAHVGKTVTQVESGDGAKITQVDSRRLLASGKIAGKESTLIQAIATVSKIDHKNRQLTLESAQGEMTELVAGPEVRNFNQISAGDQVVVEYLIAVAFEVRKPTEQELAVAGQKFDVTARAQLGEMPAAGAAVSRVKVATVEAIDKEAQTISLKGVTPEGTVEVKARYPENLSYVKVGDSVVITALRALATSVVQAP